MKKIRMEKRFFLNEDEWSYFISQIKRTHGDESEKLAKEFETVELGIDPDTVSFEKELRN